MGTYIYVLLWWSSNTGAINTIAWRAFRVSLAWQYHHRTNSWCMGTTCSATGVELNPFIHGGDHSGGLSHNHHHNNHSHQRNLVFHLHCLAQLIFNFQLIILLFYLLSPKACIYSREKQFITIRFWANKLIHILSNKFLFFLFYFINRSIKVGVIN